MLVLTIISACRDSSVAAAYLQKDLINKSSAALAATSSTGLDIFGYLTKLLRLYMNGMSEIDRLASCDPGVALERSGSQLPFSFAVVRDWHTGMCKFGRECLAALLGLFDRELALAVDHGRTTMPAFEVIFEGGAFSEEVAKQTLPGKTKKVVHAHIRIYQILKSMGSAGKCLEVVPKLQDHTITSTTVKIAQSTLERLTACSVLMQGFELYQRYRDHPSGSETATNYMQKHRATGGKTLPSAWWEVFENLAAHVAVGASPGTSFVPAAARPYSPALSRSSAGAAPKPTEGDAAVSMSTTHASTPANDSSQAASSASSTGEARAKTVKRLRRA